MAGEAVLLVEDEETIRSFLEQQLTDDGFDVVCVDRAGRALEQLERVEPDLVLLDGRLPDASGYEVCRRLREGEPGRAWNRDVPVIIVSERGEPIDRLRGFARGCDDYVVKPFVYEELVARMRAVLRRAGGPDRREHLSVGEIEIDRRSRGVTAAGEAVALAAKEYELLVALAADPELVFTKEELLRDVWGFRSLGRKQKGTPIGLDDSGVCCEGPLDHPRTGGPRWPNTQRRSRPTSTRCCSRTSTYGWSK